MHILESEDKRRVHVPITVEKGLRDALDAYIKASNEKTPFAKINRSSVSEGLLRDFLTKEGYIE